MNPVNVTIVTILTHIQLILGFISYPILSQISINICIHIYYIYIYMFIYLFVCLFVMFTAIKINKMFGLVPQFWLIPGSV